MLLISFEAQAELIPDSEILKASKGLEWQRLLHYRKNLFGQSRSALQGPNYFLASDGESNPYSELQASVDNLFEKKPSLQCEYLARTDFIMRTWPVLSKKAIRCEFYEGWKAKLSAKKVSLIFATSYLNNAASSFGHIFLRLENPKNISRGELLDYGVNFSARTENTLGALYALYGLTGYFPGRFAMLPYHQLIKEYTNLEGRDLWEYQLNLTEFEIDRLLKYLLEMEKIYIDYYFLDDNCSFQVMWALQVIRPELNLVHDDEPWMIPLDTIKIAERAHLIESKKYRPSLIREWQTRFQALTPDEKQELHQVIDSVNAKNLSSSPAVIEAAQVYTDLKIDDNLERKKEKSFLLARQRAKLPMTPTLQIPSPLISPEETHDSSSVGLSQGRLDSQSYQSLHLEGAFHAWLSDDTGVSPFSELKLLNFEVRKYPEQLRLEKAVLLKILSSQSIDRFFQPVSWGVEVSYDHYLLARDADRPLAKGQVGYSIDPIQDTRLMGFLYAGLGRNLEQNISGLLGVEVRVLSKLGPHWRLGLIARNEAPSSNSQLMEGMIESTIDLSRQWELRFYHQAQKLYSNTIKTANEKSEDFGVSIYHTFILPGF